MPLWIVYYPPGTFVDDESKQAFSKDITSFYTDIGIPAFYVVTNFIQTPPGNVWIGGEAPQKPFVRISVDHIAGKMPAQSEHYNKVTSKLWGLIKPHTADKGYHCEYHIAETERELARMDGLIPPPRSSEAEKVWFQQNKATYYEGHPEPVKA